MLNLSGVGRVCVTPDTKLLASCFKVLRTHSFTQTNTHTHRLKWPQAQTRITGAHTHTHIRPFTHPGMTPQIQPALNIKILSLTTVCYYFTRDFHILPPGHCRVWSPPGYPTTYVNEPLYLPSITVIAVLLSDHFGGVSLPSVPTTKYYQKKPYFYQLCFVVFLFSALYTCVLLAECPCKSLTVASASRPGRRDAPSSPSACAIPLALPNRTGYPCLASVHPAADTGSSAYRHRSRRKIYHGV